MKLVLIFMLAGSLFVPPAGSFKCYTCKMQFSNSKCQGEAICDGNTTACRTDMIRAVGLLTFITKECSFSCQAAYFDHLVANRNISCCDTELCNLNGAGSFGTSYTKVTWAVSTSFALSFLRSGP